MIFHPQNTVKKDGAFIFSKNVIAAAAPCLNKDIIKEFWFLYSCRASTLEINETDGFLFKIGEAELLSLDGMEYTINVERTGIALNAKDEKSLLCGFMTLLDHLKATDERGELEMKAECVEIKESALIRIIAAPITIVPMPISRANAGISSSETRFL